jgi:hypothetical protein
VKTSFLPTACVFVSAERLTSLVQHLVLSATHLHSLMKRLLSLEARLCLPERRVSSLARRRGLSAAHLLLLAKRLGVLEVVVARWQSVFHVMLLHESCGVPACHVSTTGLARTVRLICSPSS